MDGRRKTGNEQPTLSSSKHLVELASNGAFTWRVTAALHVGRILKQREHAFFAVFGEGMKVKKAIVGRRRIYFEIAGVKHHAQRRVDCQRNAIDQAVRHLDRMNRKGPDFEALTWPNLAQVSFVEQTVFIQLVFDVGERELGAPDRDFELGKYPRQGADVVLVTVCQHDCPHALSVFDEIRNVGNDDVHAKQLGFGEHHARVNDDDVIAPAYGHAIHAEFAKPAEWDDMKFA